MKSESHEPSPPGAPQDIKRSLRKGATTDLRTALREEIEARGALSFRDFMDLALYHPTGGYYTSPACPRVGRGGDFITSVSVGNTFGRLLTRRLHQFWTANGSPERFDVMELGPEGGDLSLDILGEARSALPGFHQALRYHACERSAEKRGTLASRFREAGETRATAIASPAELEAPPVLGAVLANEVLDALPVHLVRFEDGRWLERCVTAVGDQLTWLSRDIGDPALAEAVRLLGTGFSDGYTTEIALEYSSFLAPLADAFPSALLVFIDYGFPQDDYYHPSRTEGTLRTYQHHQAGDDPLANPGRQDISAHVNFTRVLESARALGLAPHGFTRQERYLTALAEPLLTTLPPDASDTASFIRQFRTLTHPGMLGASFHTLECTMGPVTPSPEPFRFDPEGLRILRPM